MHTSGQIGGGGRISPAYPFWDFEEPINQLSGIAVKHCIALHFSQKNFEEFYFPGGIFKEPPQMTR